MPDIIALINRLKLNALAANHRETLILQGGSDWAFEQTKLIIEHLNRSYFWVGETPSFIEQSLYSELLGQETELLIFNMGNSFDPNSFAASVGTIKGGGLLILICPTSFSDEDMFSSYIFNQLSSSNFSRLTEDEFFPSYDFTKLEPLESLNSLNIEEQEKAVLEILKTVTGHRRRPLVLTANRGRGKSASLGIAAAKLIQSHYKNIFVCGPNKKSVNSVFKHAYKELGMAFKDQTKLELNNSTISFISPDQLVIDKPNCDLLLIDEAAAIPVPILEILTHHYSRLVFSTTLHGYEGSGRGFALRFQKKLKEISPSYRSMKLETPIRWAINDPLEDFTLKALCLNESQVSYLQYCSNQPVEFNILLQKDLMADHQKLALLFSLLVDAHYQTKPSDLKQLLNDPNMEIFTLTQNKKILAVALILVEGELSECLSQEIWLGKRRVKGNLLPQSLTFHSGSKDAGTHKFARVSRIAVEPKLQRMGLGNQLIKNIHTWAIDNSFDHISSSFAGSLSLISFWQELSFETLRVGLSKDASSGAHSLIVNLPISKRGFKLHKEIKTTFQKQLRTALSRSLNRLDPLLVAQILKEFNIDKNNIQSFDFEMFRPYIEGNLPFEFIEHELLAYLFDHDLSLLSNDEQILIILKILQNLSWKEICNSNLLTNHSGKKEVQSNLKSAITKLINNERANAIR